MQTKQVETIIEHLSTLKEIHENLADSFWGLTEESERYAIIAALEDISNAIDRLESGF